ncbi:MAG: UDP-N-acetylmuramate--L-alanine ligase [Bacteroidales bacterium]|nr:UDP-N-acetylmuramate--L-alanine ligase [Bacteroidales bacterium]
MNKPKEILYFLGIGGIGMSALARYFHKQGCEIYGYDLTPSLLTRQLETEGMHIHYTDDISLIPAFVDKVIYTPAIPEENAERRYFKERGIPLHKRAEVLGEISHELFTIAVSGTHGKTSITAMIAHILKMADLPLVAFIGGISKNLNSNIYISEKPEYLVVEADEFDRSLLKLDPNLAVVTSMDADHLDIYQNLSEVHKTFLLFAKQIRKNGKLVAHERLTIFENEFPDRVTYGLSKESKVYASKIKVQEGKFHFEVWRQKEHLMNVKMNIPGLHYVENALAATSIALQLEIDPEIIKKALESFTGVERRFDYRIQKPDLIYIDDYGHHPVEIQATIDAARILYPDKKISAVFQPHLYSRTRDLADEFAIALSSVDRVFLLDIYPARERPIPDVTSKIIFDKINIEEKYLMDKRSFLKFLEEDKPAVLISLGAGDIGVMVEDIERILRNR